MKIRVLVVPALLAASLLTGCSSSGSSTSSAASPQILDRGPVTNESARESLVKANLASVCSSEDFVKCQTVDGLGTFAVMVMSQADLDATFTRICGSIVTPGTSMDPVLDQMTIVTDHRSFLVVGDTSLQFPDDVDPAKIRDVLGGEVISFSKICAPAE